MHEHVYGVLCVIVCTGSILCVYLLVYECLG